MKTNENQMRRYLYWISLALGLLLTTRPSRADSLTFTVTPGDVSGPAGTTVGWGFTITNSISSTDYLDISGIDSDLFLDGVPDASIFPFSNLAPGQSATQLYDPVDQLGLFQFTWNPGLPVGTTQSGQFRLMGAFCDPTTVDQFCAEDDSVPSVVLATADYSATVSAAPGTSVPEPSSILMLLLGLCGIGLWVFHRQKYIRSEEQLDSKNAW
jgi:PEP-CTERM motif